MIPACQLGSITKNGYSLKARVWMRWFGYSFLTIWPGDRPRTRHCGLEEVIRERTTLHQTCLSFFLQRQMVPEPRYGWWIRAKQSWKHMLKPAIMKLPKLIRQELFDRCCNSCKISFCHVLFILLQSVTYIRIVMRCLTWRNTLNIKPEDAELGFMKRPKSESLIQHSHLQTSLTSLFCDTFFISKFLHHGSHFNELCQFYVTCCRPQVLFTNNLLGILSLTNPSQSSRRISGIVLENLAINFSAEVQIPEVWLGHRFSRFRWGQNLAPVDFPTSMLPGWKFQAKSSLEPFLVQFDGMWKNPGELSMDSKWPWMLDSKSCFLISTSHQPSIVAFMSILII